MRGILSRSGLTVAKVPTVIGDLTSCGTCGGSAVEVCGLADADVVVCETGNWIGINHHLGGCEAGLVAHMNCTDVGASIGHRAVINGRVLSSGSETVGT